MVRGGRGGERWVKLWKEWELEVGGMIGGYI